MIKKEVIIKNETGLHARPAGRFVNKTKNYSSDIKLINGAKEVNAKSIMSIMTLGASKGQKITIQVTGEDEEKAIDELVYYLEVDLPSLEKSKE